MAEILIPFVALALVAWSVRTAARDHAAMRARARAVRRRQRRTAGVTRSAWTRRVRLRAYLARQLLEPLASGEIPGDAAERIARAYALLSSRPRPVE